MGVCAYERRCSQRREASDPPEVQLYPVVSPSLVGAGAKLSPGGGGQYVLWTTEASLLPIFIFKHYILNLTFI